MGKSIWDDFINDVGKGFDKLINGDIVDGAADIFGGTLKGAGRTIGAAAKTIGDVSDALFEDQPITSDDIAPEDRPSCIIMSTVAMLAKMAKADGRVSKAETQFLASFLDELDLADDDKRDVQKFANEQARDVDVDIYRWAQVLSAAAEGNQQIALEAYYLLWRMARAVGKVSDDQDEILCEIPEYLGLDSDVYGYVSEHPEVLDKDECSFGPQQECSGEHPYRVLGCAPDASDAEVKRCYKQLMAQYHPDAISGKDLASGFVEFANQKSAEINAAYEAIRAERGMR